jgi:hypothetical protein
MQKYSLHIWSRNNLYKPNCAIIRNGDRNDKVLSEEKDRHDKHERIGENRDAPWLREGRVIIYILVCLLSHDSIRTPFAYIP